MRIDFTWLNQPIDGKKHSIWKTSSPGSILLRRQDSYQTKINWLNYTSKPLMNLNGTVKKVISNTQKGPFGTKSRNIDQILNGYIICSGRDGDHHSNYENVKVLSTTIKYRKRLIHDLLEIMKYSTNLNWEDGHKLSNRITSRDCRRNHNIETDAAQRTVTVTNERDLFEEEETGETMYVRKRRIGYSLHWHFFTAAEAKKLHQLSSKYSIQKTSEEPQSMINETST